MIKSANSLLLPPGFRLRANAIPILSTILGSLLSTLPVITTTPAFPPMGLLVLLGWRILRPELWHAWAALPLGLLDDLIGGQPVGTSMLLWTITLLSLDWADHRLVWRDSWINWMIAMVAISFCISGHWALTRTPGANGSILDALPQIVFAVFCFPAIARATALLDRWRLRR